VSSFQIRRKDDSCKRGRLRIRIAKDVITESGLKITPLDAAVPDTAQALIDQTAMILPHVKITELLMEVDGSGWMC
jgi:hypothetical protein